MFLLNPFWNNVHIQQNIHKNKNYCSDKFNTTIKTQLKLGNNSQNVYIHRHITHIEPFTMNARYKLHL